MLIAVGISQRGNKRRKFDRRNILMQEEKEMIVR